MIDVLAIFPHPDDETWIAGATLARAVRAGMSVRVVSLTRGEQAWDRTGSYSTVEQIAQVRTSEFYAACEALGVDNHRIYELPDGELSAANVGPILVDELERHRPTWVISFGADGGYGHLDHIACFDALATIMDAPNDITWLTTIARDGSCGSVWKALRKLRTKAPIVATDFPQRRKTATSNPMQSLPVGDELGVKLNALRAHHSQLRDGDPRSFLNRALIKTLLEEECLTFESGDTAQFGKFFVGLTTAGS